MNRKTERYRERFYAISKIDVTDIVGTVIIKTYNKDYIQLERTINYSTEE